MPRRRCRPRVRVDVGEPLPPDADAVAPLDVVAIRNGAGAGARTGHPRRWRLARRRRCRARRHAAASRPPPRLRRDRPADGGAASPRLRIRAPRLRLVSAGPDSDVLIDAAIECIADAIGSQGGDCRSRCADCLGRRTGRRGRRCGHRRGRHRQRPERRYRAHARSRWARCRCTESRWCPARRRRSEPWADARCWHCRGGSMPRWRLGTCWVRPCWRDSRRTGSRRACGRRSSRTKYPRPWALRNSCRCDARGPPPPP